MAPKGSASCAGTSRTRGDAGGMPAAALTMAGSGAMIGAADQAATQPSTELSDRILCCACLVGGSWAGQGS
jgi:hypothetical protein